MTGYSLDDALADAETNAEALADLSRSLDGRLVVPGDETYDDARRVWNGAVDRYPLGIVYATGPADVRRTLRAARSSDVGVAVRGGGHSGPGLSVTDGGLVLDVSAMNEVVVDPEAETATVGSGATWADVDAATQRHGLATPGGVVSETGVAGLTLGGGTGWLTRPYGLASDRLTAVDLITVDGDRVVASASDNPDLFRALQGGGGNFGVVVSFTFDLVSLDHEVAYCEMAYPTGRLEGIIAAFRDRHEEFDRRTTVSPYVAPLPDAPSERGVHFLGVHAGPPDEGESILESLAHLGDPVSTTVDRLPYTALQQMLDDDAVEGDRYYWKAISVPALTTEVIETFAERAREAPGARDTALIWPMGGAVADVPPDATAFAHRTDEFVLNFEAAWESPAADETHRSWVRESVDAIRSLGGEGVLPNFPGDETDEAAARSLYGQNYDWLRDVKTRWDPDDVLAPSGRIDPHPARK
ncbi:MAG: FAD-binding oxidoreductase [Halanaeroarchaeum sp.]